MPWTCPSPEGRRRAWTKDDRCYALNKVTCHSVVGISGPGSQTSVALGVPTCPFHRNVELGTVWLCKAESTAVGELSPDLLLACRGRAREVPAFAHPKPRGWCPTRCVAEGMEKPCGRLGAASICGCAEHVIYLCARECL